MARGAGANDKAFRGGRKSKATAGRAKSMREGRSGGGRDENLTVSYKGQKGARARKTSRSLRGTGYGIGEVSNVEKVSARTKAGRRGES
jgi:hypothetical protein